MNIRIDTSLLFTGALCAALMGCGDSGASSAKETPKAPATSSAPAKPAAKPAEATKPATGAMTDAAKAAGDTVTSAAMAAQAEIDKIPTQEALDAEAAKSISKENEDAEFEKLAKEIEKGDGN